MVDDSQEIFAAFTTPLGNRLNFTLYGSAGLSEGAPDLGRGARITLRHSERGRPQGRCYVSRDERCRRAPALVFQNSKAN